MPIDYRSYIQSPAWRKRSMSAKRRAKWRCQVCYSDGELHAHHRTYERLGKELASDLVVLCGECHALFHGKLPGLSQDSRVWNSWEDLFTAWGLPKTPGDAFHVYERGKGLLTQAVDRHGAGMANAQYAQGVKALATWLGI